MTKAIRSSDTILGKISLYIRWLRWRSIARRAQEDGRAIDCALCCSPIIPGDVVAELASFGNVGSNGEIVHSGYGPHFTFENSKPKHCSSDLSAIGEWNGMWVEKYEGLRERVV